ncbi:hypothetical protein K443DRAFT_675503 [Laccaria amethystina LaAM-08-1]|uniref:Uncharacterized protein n=1 Tax=Laccaria amethystina LaAM-08-1 TaxID=1095629 RepID=A0A0C9YAK5_9AGAR|nr:hypothetical protein K443DRAFT_675503 [Laccaria amethystina LaAM-08-1]
MRLQEDLLDRLSRYKKLFGSPVDLVKCVRSTPNSPTSVEESANGKECSGELCPTSTHAIQVLPSRSESKSSCTSEPPSLQTRVH